MPHGHCYLWHPGLLWSHVISDFLIGAAYVSISLSIYALVKKIRIPFSAIVLSFGVFIGACGATHFMEIWNVWHADYWLAAVVKIITASASVATAVWVIRLRPHILAFSEAAKVSEIRGEELAKSHRLLAEQQKALAHTARMSALGEMASGIAHEINSPLGIIAIHANQLERLLGRDQLTPETIVREARLINSTAKRIGAIINGLRAFAREGDNDPMEFVTVEKIINDALVLCQARFRSFEVELTVEGAPESILVECREVQIGQVLVNLLGNAFDAVQGVKDKWVQIKVLPEEDAVTIRLTDSGSGIPAELQEKIMQPFFTTKDVGKGVGLGLSISKGIVDSHFGSLSIDRECAHTCFVLRLPKLHVKGGAV